MLIVRDACELIGETPLLELRRDVFLYFAEGTKFQKDLKNFNHHYNS